MRFNINPNNCLSNFRKEIVQEVNKHYVIKTTRLDKVVSVMSVRVKSYRKREEKKAKIPLDCM